MALQRRHSDPSKSTTYNPEMELTTNQRKRFTDTANKAELRKEQRELYKAAVNPAKARAEAIAKAKAQMQKELAEKAPEKKKNRKMPELTFLRVLIWSIVLGAFWVWVQFMFPSN